LNTVESKTLDTTNASFFYENALSFTVADSPSFAAMVDQCIQFGQQNPGRKYQQQIDAELVVRFSIPHLKVLLLQ
jgi:hypothetical protein